MMEIPLDIRGVIIKTFEPNKEHIWCAPFLWRGVMNKWLQPLDSKTTCLIEGIIAHDGENRGSIYARGAGIAARTGQIDLARIIVQSLLDGDVITSADMARTRALLCDERKSIKILLDRQRQWPRNRWNLHDVPAWIIPAWIKAFRREVSNEQISIISGGHLLANGNWCWYLPEDSTDYTVEPLAKMMLSAP
jgi:hypothetical protein